MRHFATLLTAVDSEAVHACVTTTDPFSIMEKSDESQFFENMTIYLKTRKMLSQWTKQMRWRIKKSLPSFVSYVDVEPYAVYNIIKYNIKYTHIMRQDKPHMLTFKPFTTLLNITLNKPTLCVKTNQIC